MKFKPATVVKTLVSIVLLALVFTRVDFAQAWTQFQNLSFPFVCFALLFYTGLQVLSCLRWLVVLQSAKHSAPLLDLLSSYFAGMFLNTFLPGSLGGDVYRVYRVGKYIKDSEAAIVSVFLERFTGLIALSALAVIGLPPALEILGRWDILLLFFVCVGSLVGAVLLVVSPRLLRLMEPLLNWMKLNSLVTKFARIQILLIQFAQNRQALTKSMLLSFVLQMGIVYYHYLIAQQLKIPISFLELLIFIPIIVVVTLLPISLGGLGLKEGLWVYLFSRVGLTTEQALLLSLTVTLLGWLLSLPGAVILLLDSAGVKYINEKSK